MGYQASQAVRQYAWERVLPLIEQELRTIL
jgi:hypothetical protein